MTFMAIAKRRGEMPDTALYSANRIPSESGDIISSAYDNVMVNLRTDSAMIATRKAQDEQYETLLATEEQNNVEFKRGDIVKKGTRFYSEESPVLGRVARNDREARYAGMYEYFGDKTPSMADTDKYAADLAGQSAQQFQEDMFNTVSNWPKSSAFFGSAGAAVKDPVALAAIAGSVPIAITRGIAIGAAVEGAIGTVSEGLIQLSVREWQHKQGKEYTDEDVMNAMLLAGLFSAGAGGVLSGAYKALGGTNTRLLTGGPSAAVRRDPVAIKTLELETDLTTYNETYALPGSTSDDHNPFKQTQPSTLVNRMVDMDAGALGLDQNVVNMQITNTHLATTNSWRHSLVNGTGYDIEIYSLKRAELDADHQKNVAQAITDLEEGNHISIAHDKTSIELIMGDTPMHYTALKSLAYRGIKLTEKSKAYRAHIFNTVRRIMEPKLQRSIEGIQLPADGKVLPPAPGRPKSSVEQLDTRYNNYGMKINENTDRIAEGHSAIAKMTKDFRKAKGITDEYITWFTKQTADVRNAIAKLEQDNVDLAAKKSALRPQYMEHAAYRGQQDIVDRANLALKHSKDLEMLRAGKLPKSMDDLAARLDATYKELAKDTGALDRVFSKEAEGVMGRYQFLRSSDWSKGGVNKLDDITNVRRRRPNTPAEQKAINEMMELEASRIDPTVKIHVDGEPWSFKRMMDDIAEVDKATVDAKECGLK